MSQLQLEIIDSLAALRAVQPAWDDLWLRSSVTYPTARAEMLLSWLRQFRPQARFAAVMVRREEKLLAALPLVATRMARVMEVGGLTSDDWSPGGDLLLDPRDDAGEVCKLLASGLCQTGWPACWLQAVETEQPWWQALLEGLAAAGVPHVARERFSVGLIDTNQNWTEYRASWSANHRQQINRCTRRLAKLGEVRLRQCHQLDESEVEPWLRTAFEIEDRGWKGRSGSSVLRTPGMWKFYGEQAAQLAGRGELELDFLEVDSRPVAFLYGFRSKGVLHLLKSGYVESVQKCSPGQLLLGRLLKRAHTDPEVHAIDLMGIVGRAMSCWLPRTMPVSRVLIAPNRLWGQPLTGAYKHLWPALSRLRRRTQ